MPRHASIGLTVLLTIALVAGAAAPVAATHEDGDSEDSFFDGLIEPVDGVTQIVLENTADVVSQVSKQVAGFQTGDTNATDDLRAFADTYNEHNGTIEEHASQRIPTDANHTSIRLTCTDTEGREATRYLIGDYNNSTDAYENTRIVDQATFDNTGREVDGYVEGDWYVCHNAASELDRYVTSYAEPGEDLPNRYYADMMRKYASSVDSDLWGDG